VCLCDCDLTSILMQHDQHVHRLAETWYPLQVGQLHWSITRVRRPPVREPVRIRLSLALLDLPLQHYTCAGLHLPCPRRQTESPSLAQVSS
jgi:hypothetical protein